MPLLRLSFVVKEVIKELNALCGTQTTDVEENDVMEDMLEVILIIHLLLHYCLHSSTSKAQHYIIVDISTEISLTYASREEVDSIRTTYGMQPVKISHHLCIFVKVCEEHRGSAGKITHLALVELDNDVDDGM